MILTSAAPSPSGSSSKVRGSFTVLARREEQLLMFEYRRGLAVERKYPHDFERLARMSLIEGELSFRGFVQRRAGADEGIEGQPKQVRMAHLAVVGSRRVNGVAEVCPSS